MRLISQDGMIDVPYENVCVSINYRNKNQITAWNFGCEDCEIATMATYSTETKALKVMEMLREYKETKEIKSMLLTKSILESFTNTKIKNFEIHTDETGDYLKVDIVKKVEYFKFPVDEEVEV